MRSTETRLAKMEKALTSVAEIKAADALQAEIAEWREAGGPMSLVCGETEAAAWERVKVLRGLGLIQPIDRVHVLPLYPEFVAKPFSRLEVLGEHKDAFLSWLRLNRGKIGREPPPGWRSEQPALEQGT